MTIVSIITTLFFTITSIFHHRIGQKIWRRIPYSLLLIALCHSVNGQESIVETIQEESYSENPDNSSENRTERVLKFHSDITIDTTGRIVVTEEIVVFANGIDIQRGIIRSIPVFRNDKNGKRVKVDFKVLSVFRNEEPEPYTIKRTGDDKEILLGDDRFLDSGIQTYSITYESYGHIGFFDEYDELYWNVTGNDWFFEIEEASATITLPGQAEMKTVSCYTGVRGATDQNGSFMEENGNIHLYCSRHLRPKEGFTVAVSFSRDIVKRPPPPTKLELLWESHKKHIIAAILFILLSIYYYLSWRKVGKDPAKPVIIPRFEPPHGWSPADIRYLYKKKYDDKTFTASIVSLAVKRVITIDYKSKKYNLQKSQQHPELPPDELVIFYNLFASASALNVTNSNYKIFSAVKNALEKSLYMKWNIKDYFLKNLKHTRYGLLFLSIAILCYAIIVKPLIFSLILFFPSFTLVGFFIIKNAIEEKSCSGCLSFIIGVLFAAGGFSPLIYLPEDIFSFIFLIALILPYIIYVRLIKAPTILGANTFAEIEGFRMYLKTAEEHRLNMLTHPERTSELFEKMLPYAIALDVENEWGKKFNDTLKQTGFQPEWYSSDAPFMADSFTRSFSTPLTSSISSAGENPNSSSSSGGGWSSGSSGGGSSGGGGGGGGGRGR